MTFTRVWMKLKYTGWKWEKGDSIILSHSLQQKRRDNSFFLEQKRTLWLAEIIHNLPCLCLDYHLTVNSPPGATISDPVSFWLLVILSLYSCTLHCCAIPLELTILMSYTRYHREGMARTLVLLAVFISSPLAKLILQLLPPAVCLPILSSDPLLTFHF